MNGHPLTPTTQQNQTMEGILDFSGELDMNLLDRVVNTFYSGVGADQQQAQRVLTQFQEHPDAWKRVDAIIERSGTPQSKYIALQILETLIKTRWKILPTEEQAGIKSFIVSKIVALSSDEETLRKQKTLVSKMNMVLIQVLKHEWPAKWPNFIQEMLASCHTNLSLCENNMVILKLLSEEIFDFSAETMTSAKTKSLKTTMCGEFSEIFKLCHQILEQAQKPSLVKATLETLLRFLSWIPLGYIFETNIIAILRNRFLEVPQFRNVTLQCFTEMGSLPVGQQYNEPVLAMFSLVMQSINNMVPVSTNMVDAYEDGSDEDQHFIQNLANFMTGYLTTHVRLLEASGNKDLLVNAHMYLIRISMVKDREVFRVCLEYWQKLTSEFFHELQELPHSELLQLQQPASNGNLPLNLRKNFYLEVLSNLRVVMIERMVKPEEVLIVENDEGEIVREIVKESDTITLGKNMKEVLVFLTHLDVDDTEVIMTEKLAKQVSAASLVWDDLNRLCWAVGSISGAMSQEHEKRFLVTVIKDLLGLCEHTRGKDNKAVVASNIMYIVGQYPKFLKEHWKFLKTVVNKLFEFMHETHEGVQDMACDTFIKIAKHCRRHFVMQQAGEVMPYIEEILNNLNEIVKDLTNQQVHTVYEAIGHMISAQPQKQTQDRLIMKLMETPNVSWDSIIRQASQNPVILEDPDVVKRLGHIMKTNVAACSTIGAPFLVQIGKIFLDMLAVYGTVSGLISQAVVQQGLVATKTPKVRGFRTIKKEVLKLIDTYVTKTEDTTAVANDMLPPLMDAVLGDYKAAVEPARDAEVLNTMATIVSKLGVRMMDKVPILLDAVFECTLNMINKDFEEYPEHRLGFYKLLRAINQQCFESLLKLPAPQFKLFYDSIVWAVKHTMRDIADMGLNICAELIWNVSKIDGSIANSFFQNYFLSILQDIFYVLTDTMHKSGFRLQAQILAHMFNLVETNVITAPLYNPASVANPTMTNVEYLKDHMANMLDTAFPNISRPRVELFVKGLFELNTDLNAFKIHLRDFLIQLKEFSATDNSDLYLEEREMEAKMKEKAEMEAKLKIPGMVKPTDILEDDEGMMD